MAHTQIRRSPQPNLGSPNHEDASGLPTGTDPMDYVEVEVAEFSREQFDSPLLGFATLRCLEKSSFKKNMMLHGFLKNGDDLPW